jgi:3-(3-hydroxy-phenyl)propionate hydroxylase
VQRYDAIVCGYGPVGALLAARLAAHGASVLVVERALQPYGLPRAVAADGEVLELLERTAPGLTSGFLLDVPVRFLSAARTELGRVRFPRAHGRPGLSFYRQPVLEQRLRALVATLPVEVRLGTSLVGFAQDALGVTVQLSDGSSVRGDWLLGCDGAASAVRRGARLGWRGRDLPQRWLVVDVTGPPVPGRQLFSYTADPARPQVDMPVPGGHRWEWLLAGGAADPRALIAADTDPAPLRVVRAVDYRFGARRAARWRSGRVLVAGDAAHTMPPFAGQGLGAGLRDAWALAALLAAGDPSAYERLRAPHVAAATRLSLALGAALQTRSPAAAAVRDRALAGAFAAPGLGPWLARGGPRPSDSGVLDL